MKPAAMLVFLAIPAIALFSQEKMDTRLSSRFEFDRDSYDVGPGDRVTPPIVTKQFLPDTRNFSHPSTRRIRDSVVLKCVLKADGTIGDIVVVKSIKKGFFGFDKAAEKALSQWDFEPGTKNGVAIDVKAKVTFNFR